MKFPEKTVPLPDLDFIYTRFTWMKVSEKDKRV